MNDELKQYLYRERKKCEIDIHRDKRKKTMLYPISYLHKINLIEHQHTDSTDSTQRTQSTDSTAHNESESTQHD